MKEKKSIFVVLKENTLINILQEKISGSSKNTIKKYLKYGMVQVNDKIIKTANYMCKLNDKIVISFSKNNIPKIDIKIIYEDKDIIVIDKPSGLLSISNDKEKEITAFHLVSDYIKKNNPTSKLFVVHRLDENTSGVLLFSKNLPLKEKLQANWQDLVKLREYVCVVEGKMPKKGTITSYLKENHFQIVHSTNDKVKGKLAITHYELIKYKNNLSFLRVKIDTGRRNQIRVHLSEMGHPIVGDKKYGSKNNSINRLALHASKLSLIDPRTNKLITFESKIPNEIEKLTK